MSSREELRSLTETERAWVLQSEALKNGVLAHGRNLAIITELGPSSPMEMVTSGVVRFREVPPHV